LLRDNLLNLHQNLILLSMENLNRLKAVLADAGQTNKWLAEQLGKDPVTISKWCTNTTQPDLQTLSRISDLLNIDIRELLVSRNQPVQPLTKDIK
jgi:transcriptional regulator with XRE-family HTH domain